MIKDSSQSFNEKMKLNIDLKDGREFLGCDTTSGFQNFLQLGLLIFWDEEAIKIIPMDQVKEFSLYEGDQS